LVCAKGLFDLIRVLLTLQYYPFHKIVDLWAHTYG